MTKQIGFIDYYLDEAHANMYPELIASETNGEMKVTCAYGKTDSPTGLSNADWSHKKGIRLFPTVEEVVENSDYLIVLAPDHPEFHEELARLPLQSGKPTYVDKTFAPDREAALRMFETAQKHGTPLCSSSALRFATEYTEIDRTGIETISSSGQGNFDTYAIHQIEPIISMMGSDVRRVMFIGTERFPSLLIGFADGRQALVQHFGGESPFQMGINYESGRSDSVTVESDFFALFIKELVTFFETDEILAEPAETIAIMTVIQYGLKAMSTPYQWVDLP